MSLTPTPVGGDIQVNTETANDQSSSAITALNDGGFVVTWSSSNQDGSSWGIYGQRYDAAGAATWAEFLINTETASFQGYPSVTALNDGGFDVTWSSYGQDGSGGGVYGQRYNAAGAVSGAEFRVNTITADHQQFSSVTALNDGGVVVTWSSLNQDGSDWGIYGQRYHASCSTVGTEFLINTETVNRQDTSSVTALGDGGFVVPGRRMTRTAAYTAFTASAMMPLATLRAASSG